jgi:DNA-binding NarL/FixJ family response regulator
VEAVPRRPRQATRESPLGLTPRQTDVLKLLSEDLTNTEIADRLFISTRTVENHVAAILNKLGASNRTDAVAKARAADEVP